MSTKFLYGAAVQGIQNFIFQTSKLKEIVGASEIVEAVCTTLFWQTAGIDSKNENIIRNAAGNIRFIFDSEEKCKAFVKAFPKTVMAFAPGITISQAVIKLDGVALNSALQQMELLLQDQRNKLSKPVEIGFMGLERSRRTGGVAYASVDKRNSNQKEYICEATYRKLEANRGNSNHQLFRKFSGLPNISSDHLAFDMEDITQSGHNSWIAVIHADGNGLGAMIMSLGKAFEKHPEDVVSRAFRKFSEALDVSTKAATQKAFDSLELKLSSCKRYPLRPILMGGDDLTLIIRADLAVSFTAAYLEAFEVATKANFAFLHSEFGITDFSEGITACAGIAFVKDSYPFHYAVDLSEMLCKDAKRMVKTQVPKRGLIPESAFAFYKVQDSFIENDIEKIKERTLRNGFVRFDNGPYLLRHNKDFSNYVDLKNKLNVLQVESEKKEKSKAVSKLRKWVSETYKNESVASFLLDRIKEINTSFYDGLDIDKDRKKSTSVIYDLIQLHSLNY